MRRSTRVATTGLALVLGLSTITVPAMASPETDPAEVTPLAETTPAPTPAPTAKGDPAEVTPLAETTPPPPPPPPPAPVNRPPVTVPDVVNMRAGTARAIAVLANDSDPDGDRLRILSKSITVSPARARVSVDSQERLVVTPNRDVARTLRVRYLVGDGAGGKTAAILTVNVAAAAPTTRNDYATILEGQQATVNVLRNDGDPNGRKISLVKVANVKHGKTIRSGSSVIFKPKSGWTGTQKIRYRIENGKGVQATGRVYVTVKPRSSSSREIERSLARLGLPVGYVDGQYTEESRRAMCAWREVTGRKVHRGLPSKREARAIVATNSLPRARGHMVSGMNVNRACQVGYWVSGGRYRAIMPVTTGGPGFETRSGTWRIFRSISTTWEESNIYEGAKMYRSMYFSGGQAIHGSATDALVVPRPASKGCIRMLHRDVDRLRAAGFANGGTVKVYGVWRG